MVEETAVGIQHHPLGRNFKAQERYAQEILDYMWNHKDTLCDETPDGVFYRGSIHLLLRSIIPRAQAGDVVNVLREAGAVERISQGVWKLRRTQVFFDDDGQPLDVSPAVSYGHETAMSALRKQVKTLTDKVDSIEKQFEAIASLIVMWAQREGIDVVEVVGTSEPEESHDESPIKE